MSNTSTSTSRSIACVGFLVAPYRLKIGHAGLGIDAAAHAGAGLGVAAEAVLGGEDRGELHVRRPAQQVRQMLGPDAARLIGDEADPLARKRGEARRGEHIGAGGDRPAARRELGSTTAPP